MITGAKKIFLELSAGEIESGHSLGVAHITAGSLHHGLLRLGLSVSEPESQRIFKELDMDGMQ